MDLEKVTNILWEKSSKSIEKFAWYASGFVLCISAMILIVSSLIFIIMDNVITYLEYITIWN